MESDHLIETFYITKPHIQQYIPSPDQTAQPVNAIDLRQTKINTEDTSTSNHPQKRISHHRILPYYQRSYRMISKQINCSAAVSISRNSKGNSFQRKKDDATNYQFMEQFEDFFKTFIPQNKKKDDRLKKRKSSKLKSRVLNHIPSSSTSLNTSSQQDQLEQERKNQFVRSQNNDHLTFYEKLKNKIELKVEHLIDKTTKNRINKVETRPKSKKTVQKILKQKHNLKNCESHLRLSRTGLVIRLDSMETKVNDSNLRKIQNQKPKKDMIFQRCLIKNCEIVLENLQNYQKQKENPIKKPQQKAHKRYNSSILHKTYSSQQKCHTDHAGSAQDLSMLKWRQKCLNIELSCKRSYGNNGTLKEGMRVFGKYCNQMNKKLQFQQKTIKTMLSQQIEKEDQACRLYDSMSNIRPIENCLKSLQ